MNLFFDWIFSAFFFCIRFHMIDMIYSLIGIFFFMRVIQVQEKKVKFVLDEH